MPPISSPVSGSVAITISAILTAGSLVPVEEYVFVVLYQEAVGVELLGPDGRVDSHNLFSSHYLTSIGSNATRRNGCCSAIWQFSP